MPRFRPDGTHYPSMMPKLCAECGEKGTATNHVTAVAGVYAHKGCRVAWNICSVRRCPEPTKSNGLCSSHSNAQYYSERADYMRERSKRWYRENPERVAQRYEEQKAAGIHRARQRASYWRNRLDRIATEHNNRALRRGIDGKLTGAQLQGRLEMFGGHCYMCGVDAEAFDHVKPFAAGGLNVASNIRPVCHSCNSRKHKIWNGVGSWPVAS